MSCDEFEFYLTEVKAHWLEARIVLNGSHYDLSTHSNFSEPIRDICRCLSDARGLEGPVDMDRDYRHLEFEWIGEGWLYYWNVIPQPDGRLRVGVEFKGKREEGGREFPVWALDIHTDWQTFSRQAFTQALALLRQHGFTGYHSRWGKEFPVSDLMRLGHLLNGQPLDTNDIFRELDYLVGAR
ncbi:hypothetical protein [Pseudodesulfovibrio sp.]|uniref:hypothetical protein n=1 Tax=unclassified Pseudodesulfovibrio TaxID=2661612 RepID=UPI003AFFE36E